MRQFILGGNVAQPTALGSILDKAVYMQAVVDGVNTLIDGKKAYKGALDLVLHSTDPTIGSTVIPLHTGDLTFVKSVYKAAKTYKQVITIAAAKAKETYTVCVCKKGLGKNEPHKFHFSFIAKTGSTPTDVAAGLAKQINASNLGFEINATNVAGALTLTAKEAGVDYIAVAMDDLPSTTVAAPTEKGIPAVNDAKAVSRMMRMALANKGFNHTEGEFEKLYPGLTVDPLDATKTKDTGFTVFTLRNTEPRIVKQITGDDLSSIVQVAFPTGSPAIATFEKVLIALTGGALVV